VSWERLPNVLLLGIERPPDDRDRTTKREGFLPTALSLGAQSDRTHCTIPREIQSVRATGILKSGALDASYQLRGVTLHAYGHYKAAVLAPGSDKWSLCDDSRVSPLPFQAVESGTIDGFGVTMAMYVKTGQEWACSCCTLLNNQSATKCVACGEKAPTHSQAVCTVCSLRNPLGVSQCELCKKCF
jgi:hypothetical protein